MHFHKRRCRQCQIAFYKAYSSKYIVTLKPPDSHPACIGCIGWLGSQSKDSQPEVRRLFLLNFEVKIEPTNRSMRKRVDKQSHLSAGLPHHNRLFKWAANFLLSTIYKHVDHTWQLWGMCPDRRRDHYMPPKTGTWWSTSDGWVTWSSKSWWSTWKSWWSTSTASWTSPLVCSLFFSWVWVGLDTLSPILPSFHVNQQFILAAKDVFQPM